MNSNLKEINIELDKTDLSDDEYFSSLQNKIIDLLIERRRVLGIKSFDEIYNEKFCNKNKSIERFRSKSI